MAGKYTFQSWAFRSWTFASATWAGVGVEVVAPPPDRVYVSLGLYRTVLVGLGVTRQITIGVER